MQVSVSVCLVCVQMSVCVCVCVTWTVPVLRVQQDDGELLQLDTADQTSQLWVDDRYTGTGCHKVTLLVPDTHTHNKQKI